MSIRQGEAMTVTNDWNAQIVEEFRANGGKVGGRFEGGDIVLMHYHGRKSGTEYISPVVYRPGDDADTIYVFASKGGAPTHPEWYYNLLEDDNAFVEVGTQTYPVSVTEITGDERDAIYAAHVVRYPGFGEYTKSTEGIRTIPVLALTRKSS
jgi:deazaflavin-dependent oxidoreductase (nitroreductase family)